MTTVDQPNPLVKSRRRPGRPRLRTPGKEREIIRECVKGVITSGQIPSDAELSQQVGLSERTVQGEKRGVVETILPQETMTGLKIAAWLHHWR